MARRRLLAGGAALALACAPAAASAQLLLTGVGSGTSGSAQPTFSTARGAYIDQTTFIGSPTHAAIGMTNGQKLTVAYWLQGTNDNSNRDHLLNGAVIMNAVTQCEVGSGRVSPGLCLSFDNQPGKAQFNFNNSIGAASTDSIDFVGAGQAVLNVGPWNQYIITMDASGAGFCAVVHDGVNVIGTQFACNGIANGVVPDLNNSSGIAFMNSDANSQFNAGAFAEMWVAEESLVCTGVGQPTMMGSTPVSCAAANTVPPEMIAKFRDPTTGKPIYLGADGSAPTGRQPEIFLTGDGAAMATNLGVTAAGCCAAQKAPSAAAYTNGPLLPAYGPAGPTPGRPTMMWKQVGSQSSATTANPNPSTYPISAGDLLVLVAVVTDSSGSTDHNISCPATTSFGTAFTRISVRDPLAITSNTLCYGVAAAGETGPFPISWTTNTGRSMGWTLLDYRQVNATTPIGVSGVQLSTATSSITTPSLTTSAAKSVLLSVYTNWESLKDHYLPPAGAEIRATTTPATFPLMMIADEVVPAAGASTARAAMGVCGDDCTGGAGFTLEILAP